MILVIDVGNTQTIFGVYDRKKLVCRWKMSTNKEKTSDEFGAFFSSMFNIEKIDMSVIENVIISSVVPPVMYSLEHAIRKFFKVEPMIVGPGIKTGINIKVENPREVGSDIIVNAVAACELYGGPLIIVDFGTATVICAISSKNEYLGGVICPGIKVSANALFEKTSKLPKVDLVKPDTVIGRNTVSCIQSGLIYGFAGQIDYIIGRMKKEMNEENVKVIATGGLAKLIQEESETIDIVNSNLTLEGLRIVYEKNK